MDIKNTYNTKKERAKVLQSLLGYHGITLKDVCAEAGIESYNAVRNALGQVIRLANEGAISDERLTLLEEAALSLRDKLPTEKV